ncbi:N-glycosylase/DNA lyase [Bacteroidota bacterium]
MKTQSLPKYIADKYLEMKKPIRKRLKEFKQVSESDYFYELCFCLCTPQSKAHNAFQVVEKLKAKDFLNKPFNPVNILRNPDHYIRFHNQKAQRLLKARDYFPAVKAILDSKSTPYEKRNEITKIVSGFGLKETSHFMRNIGYRGLAILDRHILKHLVYCNLYKEIPKVSSKKQYFDVERKFLKFADKVGISIDELDILFWSYETGEILK